MRNFILFIIIIILVACNKSDDTVACEYLPPKIIPCESVLLTSFQDSCIEIPAPVLQYKIFQTESQYYSPSYHPGNPNIFFFTESITSPHRIDNFKVDICDGTYQKLFEGSYNHNPRWGRGGWIVFPILYNIWKIKENGDSLTQITDDQYYYNVEWVGEHSDKIISAIFFPDQNTYKTIFLNLEGEITDTLPFLLTRPHFLNNKIAGFKRPELGYIELPSYEFKPLIELGSTSGQMPSDIKWLDEDNILWADNTRGLNRININTLEQEQLKERCDNNWVANFSVSPAGNGDILLSYPHRKLIGIDSLFTEHDILLFNAYSKEQWFLELDPD